MELQLINQEICESRLYRTTASLSKLDGRDIANLVYLNTLATYLMLQDDREYEFAMEYAKKTAQYGSYNNFKTVGTDLYMLCYILNNIDNNEVTLRNQVPSTKFLRTLRFDAARHTIFIRIMSREPGKKHIANSFFLRLESQLKIKEPNYKQYRRDIANWGDLKESTKQRVLKMLIMDIRKIAMIGEVLPPLSSMVKNDKISESLESTDPHTDGTYSSALVSEESKNEIVKWCEDHNIELNTEDKIHCTIIYSEKPVPSLMQYNDIEIDITATVDSWDIFGDDKDCLVLKIKSSDLNKWNKLMMGAGATSDYDEYLPHLTINSSYSGEIPDILPEFTVSFDSIEVTPLETDYYNDDDEKVTENLKKIPRKELKISSGLRDIAGFWSKSNKNDK